MLSSLAATNRREKRDFVFAMERRRPRGKFLIARGDQRSAKPRKFRMTRPVVGEESFYRRAVSDLDRVFGPAHDLFEPAEKKHLDARTLRGDGHMRIVTCDEVRSYSLSS